MHRPLIVMLALAWLGGCGGSAPVPAPAAGPVPLRDAAHMQGYLAGGEAWQLRGVDGVTQFWSFDADGTCKAWILPDESAMPLADACVVPGIPHDATLFTAKWSATEVTLALEGITTDTGVAVPDTTVVLQWVDGKLRIGIAGRQFMRFTQRSP
jgi:hypothetical protein